MLLRKKIFLAVIISTVVLNIFLFVFLRLIIIDSFSRLESASVAKNNVRVENAMSNLTVSMMAQVGDWARWDAVWNFMADNNEQFIQENLTGDALMTLGTNLICAVSSSGTIAMVKGVDLQKIQDDPGAAAVCKEVLKHRAFFEFTSLDGTASGYIKIESRPPLLVVSRPITKSDGSGPAHGALIFGRFIDDSVVKIVADLSGYPVELRDIQNPDQPAGFEKAAQLFVQGASTYIMPLGSGVVYGFTYRDVEKNLFFILRAELPREVYAQGLYMIWLFSIVIFILGLSVAIVMIILSNIIILRRLLRLNRLVKSIQPSGHQHLDMGMPGRDEIAFLGEEINLMLDRLSDAEKKLAASEELYRELISQFPEMVLVCKNEKIVFANPITVSSLGEKGKNIIGKPIGDIIHPDAKADFINKYKELLSGSNAVSFGSKILYKKGLAHEVEINSKLIPHQGGTAVLFVFTDITEIKEKTFVLQAHARELEELNRLMVGRELKMIELKEEIGKLREQIKKR